MRTEVSLCETAKMYFTFLDPGFTRPVKTPSCVPRRATPVRCAASPTARATASAIRLSNTDGTMYSAWSSSGPMAGGNRMGGRQLHLLIDARGAGVERAAEDARKAQHVVDLVRIVGPAGGHDGDIWLSLLGHDLGRRVRHRKHDGICGHLLQIIHADHAWRRQSEKHVGPLQRILKRSPLVIGLVFSAYHCFIEFISPRPR